MEKGDIIAAMPGDTHQIACLGDEPLVLIAQVLYESFRWNRSTLDVLARVDEEKLNAALAAEAAASNRKIIVLDDDPTGVQTVHDIYVYTDWTVESLRKGFAAPEKLFFILTNSRGFTVAETTKAHREIAENTAKVAREFGMDYLIISRGDSTLRGHYPLETDLLCEVTGG